MKKLISALSKFFLFSLLALSAPLCLSSNAQAQTSGTIISESVNSNILVKTMCRVLQVINGNAGKAFAAFAILSVGIGFFTGKVSWALMIGVAAGIAAMFGAPSIVSAISGESVYDCSKGGLGQ